MIFFLNVVDVYVYYRIRDFGNLRNSVFSVSLELVTASSDLEQLFADVVLVGSVFWVLDWGLVLEIVRLPACVVCRFGELLGKHRKVACL